MSEEWKQKILDKKQRGETWSEEERTALARSLDEELEKRLKGSGSEGSSRVKDCWTEDNWKEVLIRFMNTGDRYSILKLTYSTKSNTIITVLEIIT